MVDGVGRCCWLALARTSATGLGFARIPPEMSGPPPEPPDFGRRAQLRVQVQQSTLGTNRQRRETIATRRENEREGSALPWEREAASV